MAGKQLGEKDERNLFPAAIRLIDEIRPRAIMIENVRGFLSAIFEDYRGQLKSQLKKLGYAVDWRLLNASDFGVPQLRPRVIIIAVRNEIANNFDWPTPHSRNPPTVESWAAGIPLRALFLKAPKSGIGYRRRRLGLVIQLQHEPKCAIPTCLGSMANILLKWSDACSIYVST